MNTYTNSKAIVRKSQSFKKINNVKANLNVNKFLNEIINSSRGGSATESRPSSAFE